MKFYYIMYKVLGNFIEICPLDFETTANDKNTKVP